MAPLFQEMQLDGTRAVDVLSAVASHLDQVKEAQDIANKSYAEGTSVLAEFNVQNNTVQAGVDKAKKNSKSDNRTRRETSAYCKIYYNIELASC